MLSVLLLKLCGGLRVVCLVFFGFDFIFWIFLNVLFFNFLVRILVFNSIIVNILFVRFVLLI